MARTYAKLLTDIWQNEEFRAASHEAQWLYMALISQPDLSHAGVIAPRRSRWARLTPTMNVATIDRAIAELERGEFIVIDWGTEEVLIRSFIRHDGGANNPTIRKGIQAAISAIESVDLRRLASAALREASGEGPDPTDKGLPKGLAKGHTEAHGKGDGNSLSSSSTSAFHLDPHPPESVDPAELFGDRQDDDLDADVNRLIEAIADVRTDTKCRSRDAKTDYRKKVVLSLNVQREDVRSFLIGRSHLRGSENLHLAAQMFDAVRNAS